MYWIHLELGKYFCFLGKLVFNFNNTPRRSMLGKKLRTFFSLKKCIFQTEYQQLNFFCKVISRMCQFSDYLSCIFVLKLRSFDEGVKDLGRELQIAWDLYGTNAFDNYWLFWYHSCEFGYSLRKDWKAMEAVSYFYNKTWIWQFQTYWLWKYIKFLVWRIKERNGLDSLSWW